MSDQTYEAVEHAIRAHVADELDGNMLTDWIVLTASVGPDPLATVYSDLCSETSRHSLEGLLHRGLRRMIEREDDDEDM